MEEEWGVRGMSEARRGPHQCASIGIGSTGARRSSSAARKPSFSMFADSARNHPASATGGWPKTSSPSSFSFR